MAHKHTALLMYGKRDIIANLMLDDSSARLGHSGLNGLRGVEAVLCRGLQRFHHIFFTQHRHRRLFMASESMVHFLLSIRLLLLLPPFLLLLLVELPLLPLFLLLLLVILLLLQQVLLLLLLLRLPTFVVPLLLCFSQAAMGRKGGEL